MANSFKVTEKVAQLAEDLVHTPKITIRV